MNPILEELCYLDVNGLDRGDGLPPINVSVVSSCGDNLSIHKVAGLQQGFARGRICRFRLAQKSDVAKFDHECMCSLRTPEVHKPHLQEVKVDASSVCVYGVECEYVFSIFSTYRIYTFFLQTSCMMSMRVWYHSSFLRCNRAW